VQSVEINGLDELDAKLSRILKERPARRRELHERLGDIAKSEVQGGIAASGMKNGGGRVRGWQEKHVGSGGGYAAVRAAKAPSGPDGAGAITNYTENGHKTRGATGTAKRPRQGRAKTAYVSGYGFYQKAKGSLASKALAEVNQYVGEFADELGNR